MVRATGYTELAGDVLIICNGGTPAAAGAPLRQRVLTVTALDGVDITSKDLAVVQGSTWTEAFLLIDDPGTAFNFPNFFSVCSAPDGICGGTGSGNGARVYSFSAKNSYQGRRVASNAVQFSFAWDDPGDRGRTIRLTNLRVSASHLPVPSSIRMQVSWDGPEIRYANGLVVGVTQEPMDLLTPSLPLLPAGETVRGSLGHVRLSEKFAYAWRRRSVRLPVGDADPRVAPLSPYPNVARLLAGASYDNESGFYPFPSGSPIDPFVAISGGNPDEVGLAMSGTRIIVRFSGIQGGTGLWVPGRLAVRSVGSGTRSGTATLITSAGLGVEPFAEAPLQSDGFAELTVNGGQAFAIWEIVNSDPVAIEDLQIEVLARYPPSSPPILVEAFLGPARPENSTPVPAFAIPGGTGKNCSYSTRALPNTIPATGGLVEVDVETSPGCGWTPSLSPTSWIRFASSRGYFQGKGLARFVADENPGAARSATVSIQGQQVTLTQGGAGAPLPVPLITSPSEAQTVVSSAVTLSWQAVPGATGYSVWVTGPRGDAANAAVPSNSNSVAVSLPVGQYRARVRACSGGYSDDRCGPYAQRNFNVWLGLGPAGSVTILWPSSSAELTASTNEFRWQGVPGATWYRVSITDRFRPVAAVRVDAPATSTILTLPSSYYQLEVSPCALVCSDARNATIFSIRLPAIPSTSPVVTRADVTGGNQLDVAWNPVPNADLYQIQVVQPNTGPGGGALTVAARQVSATSLRLGVPAGPASVLVAACNGDGCGPFSIPAPINPSGPNPSLPTIGTPMAGVLTQGPTVLFSWNRVAGDNGTNTTYRLYVADLSRSVTAADVYTPANFAAVQLQTDGRRYDAVVIANPGSPSQAVGPPTGFQLNGSSPFAPTLVSPGHDSSVPQGVVRLGWGPFSGGPFHYFVTAAGGNPSFSGMAAGSFIELPLHAVNGQPTRYSAVIRACSLDDYASLWANCRAASDFYWNAWSNSAGGSGVTNFTVLP